MKKKDKYGASFYKYQRFSITYPSSSQSHIVIARLFLFETWGFRSWSLVGFSFRIWNVTKGSLFDPFIQFYEECTASIWERDEDFQIQRSPSRWSSLLWKVRLTFRLLKQNLLLFSYCNCKRLQAVICDQSKSWVLLYTETQSLLYPDLFFPLLSRSVSRSAPWSCLQASLLFWWVTPLQPGLRHLVKMISFLLTGTWSIQSTNSRKLL